MPREYWGDKKIKRRKDKRSKGASLPRGELVGGQSGKSESKPTNSWKMATCPMKVRKRENRKGRKIAITKKVC